MKYRAELMMELLTQHMEHVEKRVGDLEEGRQPQLYALERVNLKLEKVLEGFSALNENLSTIAYGITKGLKAWLSWYILYILFLFLQLWSWD